MPTLNVDVDMYWCICLFAMNSNKAEVHDVLENVQNSLNSKTETYLCNTFYANAFIQLYHKQKINKTYSRRFI